MLANKLLIVFACITCTACVTAGESPTDRYYEAVLEEKLSGNEGGRHTLDKLFELRQSGKNVDRHYVALLDYYLGSASGAMLAEFISKRGPSILPLLKQKIGTPLVCEARFEAICTESKEHRDKRIRYLIEAIESGTVLCVDESDCD